MQAWVRHFPLSAWRVCVPVWLEELYLYALAFSVFPVDILLSPSLCLLPVVVCVRNFVQLYLSLPDLGSDVITR